MTPDHFTWRSAENLAVQHMRDLGCADATVTSRGVDGGLDVIASDGAAQVKFRTAPIGSPDIQRLRGAAPLTEHLFFYSSSGYTAAAKRVALQVGVALFRYDLQGSVWPENELGRDMTYAVADVTSVGTIVGFDPAKRKEVLAALGTLHLEIACWEGALQATAVYLRPSEGNDLEGGALARKYALDASVALLFNVARPVREFETRLCLELLEEGRPANAAARVAVGRVWLEEWIANFSPKFPGEWWSIVETIHLKDDFIQAARREHPEAARWADGQP